MGLRSALKKVISKSPVAKVALKYDPIAQDIAKRDPMLRGMGLGQSAPGVTPADGVGPVVKPAMPQRQPSWQSERIAAMRSRFSRTPATPVTATPAVPAAPATTALPAAPSAAAPADRMVRAVPQNPVADDVAAYSRSWDQGNATY